MLVCLYASTGKLYAQAGVNGSYSHTSLFFSGEDSNKSTFYYRFRIHGVCQKYNLDSVCFFKQEAEAVRNTTTLPPAGSAPFLQLHGNIAYTFEYRSRLDTPFAVKNLQQHTEQTYIDALVKDRYPFRVIINARQSNSPFFRNYTDVNIQFNQQAYIEKIKAAMIADIRHKMPPPESIADAKQVIIERKKEIAGLQDWLENPARAQDVVHEKEQIYESYLRAGQQQEKFKAVLKDSILNRLVDASILPSARSSRLSVIGALDSFASVKDRKDSLFRLLHQPTQTESNLQAGKKRLDSLVQLLGVIKKKADSLEQAVKSSVSDATDKIKNATSVSELKAIAKQEGISNLGKADKALLSVTQLGIGRSPVNYSDLTVSNVSLTGINIEYNPSFYCAFAAGSVNYLFRDFVLKPGRMPAQNLVLGRFGWGNKEKKIFIFTAYTGSKNTFNGPVQDTTLTVPVIHTARLFGYSLEAKYRLNENTDASFEVAKSSSAYTPGTDWSKSLNHAFAFSRRDNEAWSAKLNMAIPRFNSSVNLFYRQIGADFQSYSLYNTGNRQEAWGVKWRQYIFKNSLAVTLQVRKSSFDDPLIPLNYKSSMVLKSLQMTYRKRKWPVVSLGYMPVTQLIKSDGYYSQSIYYALTGSVFHSYAFRRMNMSGNLMYSRFYNQGTDSGFVLYNAKSILYSHTISFTKWTSQSDIQYTSQPAFSYWFFQQKLDCRITENISAGAGIQNNLVTNRYTSYWGGTIQLNWQIRQLGTLRIQYDKGYLPNGLNGLEPNAWGRVTWFKTF